jgi:hypothetical protein
LAADPLAGGIQHHLQTAALAIPPDIRWFPPQGGLIQVARFGHD